MPVVTKRVEPPAGLYFQVTYPELVIDVVCRIPDLDAEKGFYSILAVSKLPTQETYSTAHLSCTLHRLARMGAIVMFSWRWSAFRRWRWRWLQTFLSLRAHLWLNPRGNHCLCWPKENT